MIPLSDLHRAQAAARALSTNGTKVTSRSMGPNPAKEHLEQNPPRATSRVKVNHPTTTNIAKVLVAPAAGSASNVPWDSPRSGEPEVENGKPGKDKKVLNNRLRTMHFKLWMCDVGYTLTSIRPCTARTE